MTRFGLSAAAAMFTFMLAGCNESTFSHFALTQSGNDTSGTSADDDVGSGSGDQVACNPFGGSPVAAGFGLKANLFGLNQGVTGATQNLSVTKFLGMKIDLMTAFVLPSLDVPTRRFNTGFQLSDGQLIADPTTGDVLTEYFMLDIESRIRVSAAQAGSYQFAIISDDGVRMSVGALGGTQTNQIVIGGSGAEDTHPSRLSCASELVEMSSTQARPLRVTYFQGPRDHIALVLLWRKAADGQTIANLSQARCGTEGNTLFFNDITQAPQAAYQDLVALGWERVPPEVFELSSSMSGSPVPCASPAP